MTMTGSDAKTTQKTAVAFVKVLLLLLLVVVGGCCWWLLIVFCQQ